MRGIDKRAWLLKGLLYQIGQTIDKEVARAAGFEPFVGSMLGNCGPEKMT